MMKKLTLALALFAIPMAGFAQANSISENKNGLITVASRGNDVRIVVHDLFSQAGKNYVLDPSIRFTLYLNLKDVEFEEALMVICKNSNLKYDVQNGIYYVAKLAPQSTPPKTQNSTGTSAGHGVEPRSLDPKTTQPTAGSVTKPTEVKLVSDKGTLPSTVLSKRVTTRFDRIDLRELAKNLSEQTGIKIEIDPKVPAYRIDAYLLNTSLKFALDSITQAANLRFRMTDRMSIEIVPNVSVSVSGGEKSSGSGTGTGH